MIHLRVKALCLFILPVFLFTHLSENNLDADSELAPSKPLSQSSEPATNRVPQPVSFSFQNLTDHPLKDAQLRWEHPDVTIIQDKPLRYVVYENDPDEWESMERDWEELDEEVMLRVPLGLEDPSLFVPAYNPVTKGKVLLGAMLFFDPRLSADLSVSCSSCHDPSKGYTDGAAVATGIQQQTGGRSAPTIINAVYNSSQFWDGRAASLEQQALGPQLAPIEMGNPSHESVVLRLRNIDTYNRQFRRTFGTNVTVDSVAKAIASFERTILAGGSKYDLHTQSLNDGGPGLLTAPERRGLALFQNKAACNKCHAGANFTDNYGPTNVFHNIGSGWDKNRKQFFNAANSIDLGRFQVVRQTLVGHYSTHDIGAFKTPTMRNLSQTAPYLHDGSEKTLMDVIDFYNEGGRSNPYLDREMTVNGMTGGPLKKLNLTAKEKSDLVAFIHALNGHLVSIPIPAIPATLPPGKNNSF